jgi:polyisoprenoid-binding protein YceI
MRELRRSQARRPGAHPAAGGAPYAAAHRRAGPHFVAGAGALLLLLGAYAPAVAQGADTLAIARPHFDDAAQRYLLLHDSSLVWVEGDATLGHFRGEDTLITGWAAFADSTGYTGARGRVVVQVSGFRTGNGIRDGHLRDALQADSFPHMDFLLQGIEPDTTGDDSVTIRGLLTVRDVARRVDFRAAIRRRGDAVLVSGRAPIRFTQLGMSPPVRLLGLAKVQDQLLIGFDAVFLPAAGP